MIKPKVLVFDLETSPNLGYVWQKWQQDVIRFKEEWQLLSFSYKWLDERKASALGQNTLSEEQLVRELHRLFDEANVLIAHNARKFDVRKANAKFLEYGLPPPSPYKVVDTLVEVRRYFNLNSNKLDDIGTLLKVGNKVHHEGFDLWLKCMGGDKKAWKVMLEYNKQDVVLLEKVYLKLRPWMSTHPNYGDLSQADGLCPKCGSCDLERRGFTLSRSGSKQRFQCRSCSGWCNEASLKKVGRKVNA